MARKDRETLKNYFKKGRFPSAVHFEDLIDSVVNKIDDGFDKNEAEGMQLAPQHNSETVISFFKQLVETQLPDWQVQLKNSEGIEGLSFDRVSPGLDGEPKKESLLFLDKKGRVGINTTQPRFDLEINGTLGARQRLGTYKIGTVPGDGEWHDLLTGLDKLQAFEIMAVVHGPPGQGKYAMTHAIAISTYGNSKNQLRQIKAHFKRFVWHRYKIDLRWTGDVHDYKLQIRTRKHFGVDPDHGLSKIKFHITSLWDDAAFDELLAEQSLRDATGE